MRKVIKGFYEGEKFIRINKYLTKGSLLIIADAESGKYFIGSEEDEYVPQYTSYQTGESKSLVIAFKKDSLCDVFSYKGRKVLQNYILVSSPTDDNDFYTFQSADDEERIVNVLKNAEDISVREAEGLEIRLIDEQKMLFNGRNCVCSCDGWQFLDIRKMNKGYYVMARNCKTQKQSLFFFKRDSDDSYVNILDCEIEDFRDAKILPAKYDAVYWDNKLSSFVVEKQNLKSLVTNEGKVLENSTAQKIVPICDGECYACYQANGSLSIIKPNGEELLEPGFYDLSIPHYYVVFDYSNWYFIDDNYKYEHVKILLVKDKTNKRIIKIVWGHPRYCGKYTLKVSGPIEWIEYIDKDYLYIIGDSKNFLFYKGNLLGTYPKSFQITKDFSNGVEPKIFVTVGKKRETFYLGIMTDTETEEVKPKQYIPTEKEVSYAIGNLYAELLMGIDANPYKPPEIDN